MRILRWSLKSHTHIVVDANKHSMHIDIGVGYNHNEQKAKEKLKKPSWGLLTRAWGAPNCRPHRARTKFPSSAFSLSLFCAPHHGMGWRRSMHICSFCLWGHMVSCHSTFVSCLFSHHTNTHSIFPWFRIECDKDECIEFIWDYNFFLFVSIIVVVIPFMPPPISNMPLRRHKHVSVWFALSLIVVLLFVSCLIPKRYMFSYVRLHLLFYSTDFVFRWIQISECWLFFPMCRNILLKI